MSLASSPLEIGYCTNVHAGPSLPQMKANLERYALRVKNQVRPDAPMGVGLWLAAEGAQQLLASGEVAEFAAWLAGVGLVPFTFNGFPYGDFHQAEVKHRVYLPTWWQPERLQYTLELIELIDRLLPAGRTGSISTLPIAWGTPRPTPDQMAAAADNLCRAARVMQQLYRDTGRHVSLCLEPEPGCVLQRSDDLLDLFRDWLLPRGDEAAVREHLRVCHDVCHAAVMFEGQAEVLQKFAAAGLKVGKVQISSAVGVDFDVLGAAERRAAFAQLAAFREPRYLHQTCVRRGGDTTFYEDLPLAVASVPAGAEPRGEWRTHFHVPVYLEGFGQLRATQDDIRQCLAAMAATSDCPHFEVETYAWGVLPPELQVAELSDGIAREMAWFYGAVERGEAAPRP
jgi:sugar phosphate isomerase/epimerase